jgi:hypothetical protein
MKKYVLQVTVAVTVLASALAAQAEEKQKPWLKAQCSGTTAEFWDPVSKSYTGGYDISVEGDAPYDLFLKVKKYKAYNYDKSKKWDGVSFESIEIPMSGQAGFDDIFDLDKISIDLYRFRVMENPIGQIKLTKLPMDPNDPYDSIQKYEGTYKGPLTKAAVKISCYDVE